MPHFILKMRAKALGEAGPGGGIRNTGKGTSRIIKSMRDSACSRSCLAFEWEMFECEKGIQHRASDQLRKAAHQTVQS